MKVEAESSSGRIDLYLVQGRTVRAAIAHTRSPNGDGAHVPFTLAQFPGQTDEERVKGIDSMCREVEDLKARHEG